MMSTKPVSAALRMKIERAFTRRFGASMTSLSVKRTDRPNMLRVVDPETGSWADYDVSAWRVRRVAEHDACALSSPAAA